MRTMVTVLCLLLAGACPGAEDAPRPRIAFFPLGGTAKEELRERVTFSLRAKLDRTEAYEVIDGPKMQDVAGTEAISFASKPDAVIALAKPVDAELLVWGEVNGAGPGSVVKLKMLDLREKDARPRELEKRIDAATDLRFVSEQILETLPGVAKFEHPSEEPVQRDPKAEELWQKNPNLMVNGDFEKPGLWNAIYQAEKYPVEFSDKLPAVDKVNVYKLSDNGKTNRVLAMNLSRYCAENNGMACLSDKIEIAPNQRYRLSFRYKSDGPVLHVFVKGYIMGKGIDGKPAEREIYRRQVPVSGATDGKWVEIVDELNPQHTAFPPQFLRVDLYAYLTPGSVMFDDVVLKHVGEMTRKAKDQAIDKPIPK